MNLRTNKLEIAILGCALIFGYGVFRLLGTSMKPTQALDESIVYEMPRPEVDINAEWELGDREIDRNFEDPFAKVAAAADKAKAVAVPAKQPASVDPQAKKAKTAKNKKKKTEINVVNDSEGSVIGAEETGAPTVAANEELLEDVVKPQSQNQDDTTRPTKQKEDLLPEQWKSLLLSQPTSENMQKLIAAFEEGSVDATSYYDILNSLLSSAQPEAQAAGLQGAKAFPTAKSFVIVTKNIEGMRREAKIQAEAFLGSYGQQSRFQALAQAMATGDIQVAKMATEVLLKSKVAVGSGGSQDPRDVRGSETSGSGPYAEFIKIFTKWQQSENLALRSLAQGALSVLT